MFRGPNTDTLITLLLCPIGGRVIIPNCSVLGTQFNISDWKEEAESDGCCGCYCPFIAYRHRVIVSFEHCGDTGDTVTPIAVSLSHLSVCRGVTHDSADSVSREQCHCHMTVCVCGGVTGYSADSVSREQCHFHMTVCVCGGVTGYSADSVSREQCHCHMTCSVSVEVSPVTLVSVEVSPVTLPTVSVVSSVIVT